MVLTVAVAAFAADEGMVVVGEAVDPIVASSSQVTVIDVAALPASADLATAVQQAPGVRIQRLGGTADFAQVGIRGAGARQVEVLLDGIPLNPEGGGAVDLSEWPVRAFDKVEVVRGVAPASLGTMAMGGAVLLVPGDDETAELILSAASFGTVRSMAHVSENVGRKVMAWSTVDVLSTDGDFRFFDDGGTRFVDNDDGFVRRGNNDTGAISLVNRIASPAFSVVHAGLVREGGVPGFTFALSPSVRYRLGRQLLGARFEQAKGAAVWSGRAYGLWRADTIDDPQGEIGLGIGASRNVSGSLGLDGGGTALLGAQVRVDGGLGARLDRTRSSDPVGGERVGAREILRGAVAAHIGKTTVVSPSLLLLALWDHAQEQTHFDLLPAPRIGIQHGSALWSFKANLGLLARPPDLTERYGDRGPLIGNPDLRPERGVSLDAGVVVDRPRARAELVVFGARTADLIAWTTGPQGVARPQNVALVDTGGIEAAASVRQGLWGLQTSGSAIRTIQRSEDATYRGNQLPRVPQLEGIATGSMDTDWLQLSVDGILSAGTFADTANRTRYPPRFLVGGGAAWRLSRHHLAFELDVRNAFDRIVARVPRDPLVDDGVVVPAPVVDLTGYPLAGRAVMVSVRWGVP